ncbi:hypothetical protein [Streptomyces sp. NPDC058240]|uniref:hypothetical protein n=1 Tax=Streptomyces sp. NPDC058240 TaxID=3346396 RepID=UPI0036E513AF
MINALSLAFPDSRPIGDPEPGEEVFLTPGISVVFRKAERFLSHGDDINRTVEFKSLEDDFAGSDSHVMVGVWCETEIPALKKKEGEKRNAFLLRKERYDGKFQVRRFLAKKDFVCQFTKGMKQEAFGNPATEISPPKPGKDHAAYMALLDLYRSLGIIDQRLARAIARTVLDLRPELLTDEHWPHLQRLILTLAADVHEVQRGIRQKKVAAPALIPLATDWIAGLPAADLRETHHGNLLTPDITTTTSAIDKIIVQDLAWVVSALLQLLELRRGVPAEGHLGALPAMIKYGVGSPAACYASSIGIHNRVTATALADNCPYPKPTFRQFLDWLSQLTTDEITTLTDPETARLLIRSTERRSPRATQAAILSGSGTFTCPLRGVRHSGNDFYLAQLPADTLLDLVRVPGNEADPNAIQVQHHGFFLGWIAREIARPLALALDEDPAPRIYAQLTTDARSIAQQNGADQLHVHNAVTLTITLAPR